MVKPVSLSDKAFAALRKEKREGESDSDVVLRLIKTARSAERDPFFFVRTSARRRMMDPDRHLEMIEEGRAADADRDPAEDA